MLLIHHLLLSFVLLQHTVLTLLRFGIGFEISHVLAGIVF